MKTRINSKHLAGISIMALLLALLLSVSSAYAVEVPEGTQEVRIPVTLTTADAIAGAEVEFALTEGLTYVDFAPADGIGNKMYTEVSSRHYVGFFAAENSYAPVEESILMGTIVLSYAGADPQEVKFSEIRLHTKVSAEKVDSSSYDPATTVRLTRPTETGTPDNGIGNGADDGAGSTSDPGNGADDGAGSTSDPGNGAATDGATGAGNVRTVPLPGSSPTAPVVVERAVGDTDEPDASSSNTNARADAALGSTSSDAGIQDAATPLASGGEDGGSAGRTMIPFLALGFLVLMAAFFLVFFARRKRRQDSGKRTG